MTKQSAKFHSHIELHCDLDLARSNPIFPQHTLAYDAKFICRWTSSLEDIVKTVIFWLHKPSVWPGHWTNFSAWHSGSWCCINIQSLVTKSSVVQKTSSRQTFVNVLNLHCDLHLECSNPIFPQNTPSSDTVLPNQVWLQTDWQFRRFSRNTHILII